MIEFVLPWPPSVNHYWRHVGWRTLISREGRCYRRDVVALLAAQRVRRMSGALTVEIDAFPPDRRARDLDNLLKGLLDSIQHAGVFEDDSQVDDLHIRRRAVVPGGRVKVRIARLDAEDQSGGRL
jgi:crossover junction endodeoxyribonuclease RusA